VLLLITGLIFLQQSNEVLKENGRQLFNAVQDAENQKRIAEEARQSALTAAKRLAIRQAYSSLAKDDLPTARSLLISSDAFGSSSSQGLDERLLRHLISNQPLRPTPQSANVEEIVYIPSRELFAVAGVEGIVRLHRSADGKVVDELRFEPEISVRALAVSRDGNLLAIGKAAKPELVGSVSNDVVFWALDDRTPPVPLLDFPATVESLAFSPDGNRLAVGNRYEPVQIVNLAEPQSRQIIDSSRRCEDLVWSDDGRRVLLTPETGKLRACDPNTGEISADFKAVEKVHRFAWSPDQRWIAYTVALKPVLYVLDTWAPGKTALELTHRNGIAQSISFSSDGKNLYCGLISGHLLKWDTSDFEAGSKLPRSEVAADVIGVMDGEIVSALAVGYNGSLMAGSATGELCLFTGDHQDATQHGQPAGTHAAVLSKDGRFAITGHDSGAVTQVLVSTGEQTTLLPACDSPVAQLALSDDTKLLVIGWSDARIAFMDLGTGKVIQQESLSLQWGNSPASVMCILSRPNSDHLLVVVDQAILHCYHITRGQIPLARPVDHPIQLESRAWAIAPFRENSALIIADQIESIDLRQATRQWIAPNPEGEYLNACGAMDENTGSFVTGGHDGRLRRFATTWDIAETSLRWEPSNAADQSVRSISAITISPDGRYIFTGSDKGDVAIWEFESLLHIGEIAVGNEKGRITDIGISEDQNTIMFHQDTTDENLNDFKSGLNLIRLSGDHSRRK
jgi:WD40 repeat protein